VPRSGNKACYKSCLFLFSFVEFSGLLAGPEVEKLGELPVRDALPVAIVMCMLVVEQTELTLAARPFTAETAVMQRRDSSNAYSAMSWATSSAHNLDSNFVIRSLPKSLLETL